MINRRLLTLLAAVLAPAAWSAPTVTQLDPWTSDATGTDIARQAILPDGTDPGASLATVIYLQNLGSPRVGRDSDADIISSFLADGMLVVTMDYTGHAMARVPHLNRDIIDIRQDIAAGTFPTGYTLDNNHIFIVPAGCRLLRDLVYKNTGGSWAMDVIYPANPLIPVGALIEFSFDNNNRMNSSNLGAFHDSILSAQASEGFATAMADHPVKGTYDGTDPMPDSALTVRAAVRALRAQAAALGLNGRIATMGFSRGSGVALMAATTWEVTAWRLYLSPTFFLNLDDATVDRGTFPDEDPAVQGAVILNGRFTYVDLLPNDPNLNKYTSLWGAFESNYGRWEYQGAIDFLKTDPGYPLFLAINKDDEHAHHQMDVLQQRLDALGAAYEFHEDTVEPLAHRVTREPAILNAMNRYLRAVLMDPNPDTLLAGLHLQAAVQAPGQVTWTSAEALPPMDYAVESSGDLSNWTPAATARPQADGRLRIEAAPDPGAAAVFLRVGPPAAP